MNATRTRELIATGAMELFAANGFESTTMEDVATHVGIGTSTLYRSFPTKETVATAMRGDPSLMSEVFLSRPADEPLEVAVGHAVLALVAHTNEDRERARHFRELIEANPRLQGRILEWLAQSYEALVAAMAERSGRAADDLHLGALAWMAVFVLQRTGDAGDGERSSVMAAEDVMRALAAHPVLSPRLAD